MLAELVTKTHIINKILPNIARSNFKIEFLTYMILMGFTPTNALDI